MEILSRFNWVDVIAAIIILRMSYVAFHAGLTQELFPLAGNIVLIVICLRYYVALGAFISTHLFGLPSQIANFASFLALAIVAGIVFKMLCAIINKLFTVQCHALIEKFGGILIGVARSFMSVSLILMMLSLAPFPYLQRSIRDKSFTGMYFLRFGPDIYSGVAGFLPWSKIDKSSISKDEIINRIAADKNIFQTAPSV